MDGPGVTGVADADVLVVSERNDPGGVLPALALLPHPVRLCGPDPSALFLAGSYPVVLVDACGDVAAGKELCARFSATGGSRVAAVLREESLVAVNASWMVDGFFLPDAGPAEVDARLRLLRDRPLVRPGPGEQVHRLAELVVDEAMFTAFLRGRPLELTSQEFALLTFLVQHPGRVFTRAELLQQLWGEGSPEGTRTVDVHVRRLRAKLGPEHERMIATVRKVGYKAVAAGERAGHVDFTAGGQRSQD